MTTQLPPLPWHGGCQCGQLTYMISKLPLTLYACHCTQCQQQSASAFGLSLWVEKSGFTPTGKINKWSRKTDSGNILDCYFCPDCGSRVWHESKTPNHVYGTIISLKAGSLPIARNFKPIGHIWTDFKHAATIIPDDTINFSDDRMDDTLLVNAWQLYLRTLQAE